MASIEITAYESQELLRAIADLPKASASAGWKLNKTSREVVKRMEKQVAEKIAYNKLCFMCDAPKNKRNANYCTNPKCDSYLPDKDITWETPKDCLEHLTLRD